MVVYGLDKVFCDMAVFLHTAVLTQEAWTVVILEANPHQARGAAQAGCKLQLYGICCQHDRQLNPSFKDCQVTTYSIHLCRFNGK